MNTLLIRQLMLSLLFVLTGSLCSPASAEYEEVIYYHNDALGSPVVATNSAGEVLWREEYSPYGSRLLHESREIADCGNASCPQKESPWDEKQWFTGKIEETPLGIQYFGARWYEPEVGRFLSVDPIKFDENNLFSFNPYAYANDNPYSYVDPDGRAVETAWDLLNIGLGAASFLGNVSSGNWGGAALDGAGIILDVAAAAIPFVPGGAGSAIRAGRGADKLALGATSKSKELRLYRPLNNGAIGKATSERLSPGTLVDRYGYEGGTYVSPLGTPIEMRSLTPSARQRDLYAYKVVKPINAETARIAPAFNQVGLGIQHKLPGSVGDLVRDGYLERLKK